jgi:hypothetical protein
MPLVGKGMPLTSMDIDTADKAEFDRWYHREHLEERVAIDGFLEARRYVAHESSLKYLSIRFAVDGTLQSDRTPRLRLSRNILAYIRPRHSTRLTAQPNARRWPNQTG